MNTSAWRCYLRLPPGHTWAQVVMDEKTFLRCERCGMEKWPVSPGKGEETIRTVARGFGDPYP
jgi:hypothetical protein